jgi:hypothetical protein
MRNDAASAAALLCFLDVMALGGAWYACGNLVAPVVGALAINAVDWHHFHQVWFVALTTFNSTNPVMYSTGCSCTSLPRYVAEQNELQLMVLCVHVRCQLLSTTCV